MSGVVEKTTTQRRIVAVYSYRDELGREHYQRLKYRPKDFSWRRPDGNGEFIPNLDGVERFLYRLPELCQADREQWVFFTEGEKDCDNVRALGLEATTSGSTSSWRDEFAEGDFFYMRRICILPDHHAPGMKFAQQVAAALHGHCTEIKIVELPNLGPGEDASNWMDNLDCKDPEDLRDALVDYANAAPVWEPTKDSEPQGYISQVAMRKAMDIETHPVRWLWPARFPSGKLSLIIGHPGCGKSLLTVDMAARVSQGRDWPDGSPCVPGNAVILSGEDDASDTICPRLKVACADQSRVSIMDGINFRDVAAKEIRLNPIELDTDIRTIKEALKEVEARVFIIDPISSFIGKIDDNRNAATRRMLSALSLMAQELNCAVVCVSHLRKSGGKAVHQAVGSLAYTAAARASWLVAEDDQDDELMLMLPVKSNLTKESTGLSFRITSEYTIGDVPVLSWQQGEILKKAEAILNPGQSAGRPPEARQEAEEWLTETLSGGPRLGKEVIAEAKEAGIPEITLRRARLNMGVKLRKDGFRGPSLWYQPNEFSKDAHPFNTDNIEQV